MTSRITSRTSRSIISNLEANIECCRRGRRAICFSRLFRGSVGEPCSHWFVYRQPAGRTFSTLERPKLGGRTSTASPAGATLMPTCQAREAPGSGTDPYQGPRQIELAVAWKRPCITPGRHARARYLRANANTPWLSNAFVIGPHRWEGASTIPRCAVGFKSDARSRCVWREKLRDIVERIAFPGVRRIFWLGLVVRQRTRPSSIHALKHGDHAAHRRRIYVPYLGAGSRTSPGISQTHRFRE
ncbi:hypothetical protein BC628DRAFT_67145 [Trametes gibbosa]|nr:hypothetical protein BC628DRAFT_67145 [Trametes gibbosa]